MTAREQYQLTYRECRTNRRVGLDFSKVHPTQRTAAHNASKAYFALRFARDTIETMQIRLSNAKERQAIRRANEIYYTQIARF